MPLRFGRPKHLREIALEDFLRYPVWIDAHDEKKYDEEWRKPVVEPASQVVEEILMFCPDVLFKVEGTSFQGTGVYVHSGNCLFSPDVWIDGSPFGIHRDGPKKLAQTLRYPAILIVVPAILDQHDLRFKWNSPADDRAVLIQ
jgi:hypothetical protein